MTTRPRPYDETSLNALFHNPSERIETIFSKYNEFNPMPKALAQGRQAKALVVQAMSQVIEKRPLEMQTAPDLPRLRTDIRRLG